MERSVVGIVAGLTRWLRGRVYQARTNAPPWRCADCGAANHPATLECCRGCGDRGGLELTQPAARPAGRHVAG